MRSRLSTFIQNRIVTPLTPRLIAVDLGSSHIKVVLAERRGRKVRVLEHQIVDLQAEGLITVEEINRHLREVIEVLGNYPVALAVPQHMTISHLVDLPSVPEREVTRLIHQESINLGGLSGGGVLYHYDRLAPFDQHANPFWVTISQEREINQQINRLKDENNELGFVRVQASANAMITTWLAISSTSERVVLVDMGATSTVVAVVENRQGVFAASFPIGGESFTNEIAAWRKCRYEEAELIKRTEDMYADLSHASGPAAVADIWLVDLRKLLLDWAEDNRDQQRAGRSVRVIMGGGGAIQPGLLAYLRRKPGFEFQSWPELPGAQSDFPLGRYATAYGLLLQSFHARILDGSLLPPEARSLRMRQTYLQRATAIGYVLLAILLLLVMTDIIQKVVINGRRARILAKEEVSVNKALSMEKLIRDSENQYAELLPLAEHQKKTADILNTLQLLQTIRERRDLWFLSFADQESYLSGATARSPETNFFGPFAPSINSNRIELPTGYVAELYIPDKGGDKLKTLNSVVDELSKEPLYRNVDSLAANQRNTNIVDPRIMPPDRVYSLSLELAEKECPRPWPLASLLTNAAADLPPPR